jgi:hypothetical protein
MDTECAMLLSAGISAAAVLLTLLMTKLFDARSEKRKERERFFYEVFPKRLGLYEEIIKAMDYIDNTETPFFSCKSAWDLSDFYKGKCGTLADLGYRCIIFGSARVSVLLVELHSLTAEVSQQALGLGEPFSADIKQAFIDSFTPRAVVIKLKIVELIREESGVYVIGDKTNEFFRDIKKKKNVHKKARKDSRTGCG